MIRILLLALLIAPPALASTEIYSRSHETMVLVRGVADDRDAVDLFLSMRAPVVEIGNMWRKQIRVEGSFDLVCRASLITRALGVCSLKLAPGFSSIEVADAGPLLEKSFVSKDGRVALTVLDSGALKMSVAK